MSSSLREGGLYMSRFGGKNVMFSREYICLDAFGVDVYAIS